MPPFLLPWLPPSLTHAIRALTAVYCSAFEATSLGDSVSTLLLPPNATDVFLWKLASPTDPSFFWRPQTGLLVSSVSQRMNTRAPSLLISLSVHPQTENTILYCVWVSVAVVLCLELVRWLCVSCMNFLFNRIKTGWHFGVWHGKERSSNSHHWAPKTCLHKRIHCPCCKQLHVGWLFFLNQPNYVGYQCTGRNMLLLRGRCFCQDRI